MEIHGQEIKARNGIEMPVSGVKCPTQMHATGRNPDVIDRKQLGNALKKLRNSRVREEGIPHNFQPTRLNISIIGCRGDSWKP